MLDIASDGTASLRVNGEDKAHRMLDPSELDELRGLVGAAKVRDDPSSCDGDGCQTFIIDVKSTAKTFYAKFEGAPDGPLGDLYDDLKQLRDQLSVSPLATFRLSESCEKQGTGVTTRARTITDVPPRVQVTSTGNPARVADLTREAIEPLARMLATDEIKSLFISNPTPGQPHPGMDTCTLVLEHAPAPDLTLRWMDADTIAPGSVATLRQLRAVLDRLEKRAR